jgi:uncharacterized SAM-binding protein YcdF (DUF218 family)
MLFVLRKIVSLLLLPFNVSLFSIICGLLLLFTRRQRAGKILISFGLLLLLIFSLPPVSNRLIGSLESDYKPLQERAMAGSNVRWIVVLGGGHNSSRPAGSQLSSSSLARVTEAVRIYRLQPGIKMILSGGAVFDPLPNAEAMASTARIFGVKEGDIVLESESMDTEAEARLLAPILKNEPFYLVTSAVHMPRSMALFKKQKLNPIPAPADYAFKSDNSPFPLRTLPNANAFQQSERALREYMGMTWSRLRGKAD